MFTKINKEIDILTGKGGINQELQNESQEN